MDITLGITVLFVVFFILLMLNVPISFAIIVSSLVGMLASGFGGLAIIQTLQASAESGPLLAIPFFVIAGIIMDRGGVTKLMIDFAFSIVGHIRGGLALVNVMGGMLMGGISGSSVADTASIGSVMIPAMKQKKYDIGFTTALTASSGTIGAMIPPSIPMVILGITANVSIGGLFLAGIVPGIILGLVMMVYAYYVSKKHNYPTEVRVSSGEVLRRLINAILPLLTVVIIIVGVVGGVFTATEAGAVACIYALFLGMFVYKKISWKDIPDIFKEGCLISAAVMLIVVASSAFGYVLTYSHLPENLVQLLLGITENKYFLLFLINVFLLILGTFLDPTPIILLVAPILYPIVIAMGVDPIQFGTMFVLNMAIGNLTPPVGVVLFTAAGIAKVGVESVLKPMIPLWIIMIGILLLVTYVPAFSLFIPNLLMP
ncbi:TRAP transporter large permease [Priestia megaterium]